MNIAEWNMGVLRMRVCVLRDWRVLCRCTGAFGSAGTLSCGAGVDVDVVLNRTLSSGAGVVVVS